MSSAPPLTVLPHVVLDNTMGASFIGVLFAAILYGVSCTQAWYYFTHQDDALPIKLLVSAVMICDTLHQALISYALYKRLISTFGDFFSLQQLNWSDLVVVTISGLTAVLVQSFMTYRIWKLSRHSIWVVGVTLLLMLGGFACSLTFTVKGLRLHNYLELIHLKALSLLVNALSAACDVVITIALCVLLHNSRSGFQKSDMIINKLILFAINTGCFTSLCAVASFIAEAASDRTYIFVAFYFSIGRLYTNNLLATLNGRELIRGATNQGRTGNLLE